MFTVAEALEDLGPTTFEDRPGVPYAAVWSRSRQRAERTVLEGHTDWVNGICPVQIGARHLLATTSDDHTVRLWDTTGREVQRIPVHHPALSCVQTGELLIVGTTAGLLAITLRQI